MASVQPSLGIFFSLANGFCQPLSDRKTIGILALLSMLGDFSIFSRRRDNCLWGPSPSNGFSCLSFFRLSCLLLGVEDLNSKEG